jgi:cytolysin (calcineurin-like family phosphatase)
MGSLSVKKYLSHLKGVVMILQEMRNSAFITIIFAITLLGACKTNDNSFAFLIIADTHFKGNDSLDYPLAVFADQINNIHTRILPDTIDSENSQIKGLILIGDITQDGKTEEWQAFLDHYGSGSFPYPVFEGFGNHDGNVNGPVREGIKLRNSSRQGLTAISDNGLHYAWKWDEVHFLQLNLYPADEWDPECGWCHYFRESFREPQESLKFLSNYLDRIPDEPVILFFHYGWDDFSKLWWTEKERDLLYYTIKDHHVIGIFTGHRHVLNHYSWNGLDVWAAGSPSKTTGEQEFLMVKINKYKMTVMASVGDTWTQTWEKSLQRSLHNQ